MPPNDPTATRLRGGAGGYQYFFIQSNLKKIEEKEKAVSLKVSTRTHILLLLGDIVIQWLVLLLEGWKSLCLHGFPLGSYVSSCKDIQRHTS